MINRLCIVHESGYGGHFRALRHLASEGELRSLRTYCIRPTAWLSQWRNGKREGEDFGLIANALGQIRLLLESESPILFGLTPCSMYLAIYRRLAKTGTLTYLTSWPFWQAELYPYHPRTEWIHAIWRKFLQEVTAVAVTQTARESLLKIGCDATYIPHSVDSRLYKPTEGVHEGPTRVLYVGRLEEEKGITMLLRAARDMSPDITFEIVGEGSLRAQVEAATARGNIAYAGAIHSQREMVKAYQRADIVAVPSKHNPHSGWEELFGMTIIEAFSCGIPVVASASVGPSEIIDHGANGFLFPQGNLEQFEGAIAKLASNRENSRAMGLEGRKKAVHQYDVRVVARMWMDYFTRHFD